MPAWKLSGVGNIASDSVGQGGEWREQLHTRRDSVTLAIQPGSKLRNSRAGKQPPMARRLPKNSQMLSSLVANSHRVPHDVYPRRRPRATQSPNHPLPLPPLPPVIDDHIMANFFNDELMRVGERFTC